jgi:hypothetical protein
MPPMGAERELRTYSESKNAPLFAGCYCEVGTAPKCELIVRLRKRRWIRVQP